MNINTLDERDRINLLKALQNLRSDRNFDCLYSFLVHQQEVLNKELRRADEKFQIVQGKSQFLEGLIDLVETSQEVLLSLQEIE